MQSDSATMLLERICGGPISVRRLRVPARATPEVLTGPVSHRRVQLRFGDHLLSEADLWFRPEMLSGRMIRALAKTDEPFGRVVQALGLKRRVFWHRIGDAEAAAALEHRAVLSLPGGADVAEVFEQYGWHAASGADADGYP